MYFSPLVKQELARIMPDEKFEQISELLSFVIMNGKINSYGGLLITLDNRL